MTGEVGAHTNRPEWVLEHGYGTKYAMHALRLGVQGVELLTTGRITSPVPEPARSRLRAVRHGAVPLPEVLTELSDVQAQPVDLQDSAAAPAEPDRAWVDGWLHRAHRSY